MAEAKMRVPFGSLAAFATFLVAGSILVARSTVSYAAAADTAPGDTAQKVPECLYRDAHYGPGAVICVAPQFGQRCDKGTWTKPTSEESFDKICASAKISVPGIPPAQCMYHDVKYAPGAMICVAPHFGLICNTDGGWNPAGGFEKACANAQIPAPTYPAAPAGTK
jgi:hypothetical protein